MANGNPPNVQLCPEDVAEVRRALLIGLEAFGEIERLTDVAEGLNRTGSALPRSMHPLHPTGSPDTVARFATALRLLER